MELSRRQVPLYGQVEMYAVLQTQELVPGDGEVYIVLEGSTLDHITAAQRSSHEGMLGFVVPGHNLLETVTVTAYVYTAEGPVSCLHEATLEYVQDDAQELSEFLVTHCHCLSTGGSQDILRRYGLGDEATRRELDKNVARAMANLDYPYTWNILGSPPGEVLRPRESLLHLAVRLGFLHLSELLLCQPGGLMAVAMPNEEGDTPLQLAQRTGQSALLELLTNPPNPLVTPLAGVSQVWADSSRLLRFCHESNALTMTVRRAPERNQRANILLLRKSLRDDNFLKEVFEEQLILCLDEEDEPAPSDSEGWGRCAVQLAICQRRCEAKAPEDSPPPTPSPTGTHRSVKGRPTETFNVSLVNKQQSGPFCGARSPVSTYGLLKKGVLCCREDAEGGGAAKARLNANCRQRLVSVRVRVRSTGRIPTPLWLLSAK
ncbi:hypothetical protein JZ751_001761 [Albula glossodonta]|uniref:Uncharacterized protein n=1 Tax=Albula glossodonta TaxID=121402 RepID=A0A8T2PUU8_9TELE|nr:hypothetical protein JZ751_001761 [Albula glossodonta]